jgi:hypothetical protein
MISVSKAETMLFHYAGHDVNILASGNLNSGNVETGVPEHGNRLDWLNGYLSGTTHLSSPEPLCGARQALQLS